VPGWLNLLKRNLENHKYFLIPPPRLVRFTTFIGLGTPPVQEEWQAGAKRQTAEVVDLIKNEIQITTNYLI
jgi:hypothetical protein